MSVLLPNTTSNPIQAEDFFPCAGAAGAAVVSYITVQIVGHMPNSSYYHSLDLFARFAWGDGLID